MSLDKMFEGTAMCRIDYEQYMKSAFNYIKEDVRLMAFNTNNFEQALYEGFDPTRIRAYFSKKARSDKEVIPDLAFLCMVVAVRGTNANKILKKSTDAMIRRLQTLITKYNISVMPARGGNRSRDEITLARICACYPFFTCEIMASVERKVVKSAIVDHLPGHMRTQFFFAMIAGEDSEMLFDATLYYAVLFDRLINKKKPTDEGTLRNYAMAARNSPVPDIQERIKYLTVFGITDMTGRVLDDVRGVIEMAASGLTNLLRNKHVREEDDVIAMDTCEDIIKIRKRSVEPQQSSEGKRSKQ